MSGLVLLPHPVGTEAGRGGLELSSHVRASGRWGTCVGPSEESALTGAALVGVRRGNAAPAPNTVLWTRAHRSRGGYQASTQEEISVCKPQLAVSKFIQNVAPSTQDTSLAREEDLTLVVEINNWREIKPHDSYTMVGRWLSKFVKQEENYMPLLGSRPQSTCVVFGRVFPQRFS